ncbi:uncharacterized protein LOC133803366 [Humulus lupulus]|uniref:uncharacterized protein LOC133803366 n=1 Tax=Humulus lupulus TaxID=3486 RepID=UPI002B40624C|nr:uncharacterized protein LOC133803366 [Humulus lupulus]
MSKMRSVQKPPLAKSPIRLRPRWVLPQISTTLTPPGSQAKSLMPIPNRYSEDSEIRPEYHTISRELRALAKQVQDEFGNEGENLKLKTGVLSTSSSSGIFERGRFYEEYSARRNERLRRKMVLQTGEERIVSKSMHNLGVNFESAKRSSVSTSKKIGSLRKSISSAYSVEKTMETSRYMLRSMSKENKKPPLPLYPEKSAIGGKVGARRVRKTEH